MTATGVLSSSANCEDCHWTNGGRSALGLAAQHHDATGHYVVVEQTITVAYGEKL